MTEASLTAREYISLLVTRMETDPRFLEWVQNLTDETLDAAMALLKLGALLDQGEYSVTMRRDFTGPWHVRIFRSSDEKEVEAEDSGCTAAIRQALQDAQEEQKWHVGPMPFQVTC